MISVENLLKVSKQSSSKQRQNGVNNSYDYSSNDFKDIIKKKSRSTDERAVGEKKANIKPGKKEKPTEKIEDEKKRDVLEQDNKTKTETINLSEVAQINGANNEMPVENNDVSALELMNIDDGTGEIPEGEIQDLISTLKTKDILEFQGEDEMISHIQIQNETPDTSNDGDLEKLLSDLNLTSIKSEESVSKETLKRELYSQRVTIGDEVKKPQKEEMHAQEEKAAEVDVNGEMKISLDHEKSSGFLGDMEDKEQFNILKGEVKIDEIDAEAAVEGDDASFVGHLKGHELKSEPVHIKPVEQALQRRVMEQISDKIKVDSTGSLKSLEIKLEPESLGKVILRIVSENGTLSAKIITSNEKVKSAIDMNMEEVKETLAQQGIDIKSIDVSVDSDGKGDGFEGLFKKQNKSSSKIDKAGEDDLGEMQFEDVDLKIAANPYSNTEQEFNYLA